MTQTDRELFLSQNLPHRHHATKMLSKSQVLEQGLKTNEWETYSSLLIESLDSIGFDLQGKDEIMKISIIGFRNFITPAIAAIGQG